MLLPKDFYRLVEQYNYLKHILYGDSVSKDTTTLIKWKDSEKPVIITFDSLWDKLSEVINPINIGHNEYIFITDEFSCFSYDIVNDEMTYRTPPYLMRHKFTGHLTRLFINNTDFIDVSRSHSLLEYDNKHHCLKKVLPDKTHFITIPNSKFNCLFFKDMDIFENTCTYYGKSNSVTKDIDDISLKNIKPCEISERKFINYNDYIYDFEIRDTHIYLANGFFVHNTDSLFITLPYPEKNKTYTPDQIKDIVNLHSENINDLIIKYKNEYLLPKCNISPLQNKTSFKTEMILVTCLFLHVKKNYTYKKLMQEGKLVPEGKNIGYVNMQIRKSDSSELSKDILKEMIVNIALNEKLPKVDKLNAIIESVSNFQKIFDNYIENYSFVNIGLPGKWSKKKLVINGMLIYNHIMGKKIFTFGSSGKFVYCTFENQNQFFNIPNIDKTNIKGICIPYVYDIDELRMKFDKFGIKIDKKTQWDKIFSTTCINVITVVKESCGVI